CAEYSFSPSSLVFLGWISPLLGCFVFRGIEPLDSCFAELFMTIPMHLSYCQTPWNREFSRIGIFVFLRKPQSTLFFPRILKILLSFGRDLLGICSRDRCEGILQVSLDLDFVCSRFAIWSFGCGLSGSDRSV